VIRPNPGRRACWRRRKIHRVNCAY